MSAKILDGKIVAKAVFDGVAEWMWKLDRESKLRPGLAVVLVGDDPASSVYVKNKEKKASELGMAGRVIRMPSSVSLKELLGQLDQLNRDTSVHGILVQLPLPKHLPAQQVINAIAPEKDVDGFHPLNVGALAIGERGAVPCTPRGVMRILEHYGVPVVGRHAVVLGRSNIVGKPMAQLLLRANATVTICHSKTERIEEHTRRADIVVAAMGVPRAVKGSWIKPGATVIDVGIHKGSDGKLCGDVDADEVMGVAGALTPVPGGVGPMTIAMLMLATCEAAMETLRHPPGATLKL